jgi:hypothetical protein
MGCTGTGKRKNEKDNRRKCIVKMRRVDVGGGGAESA